MSDETKLPAVRDGASAAAGAAGQDRYPRWFVETVAEGVALLLVDGMEFAPRGDAVDESIKLFCLGIWQKALDEGEEWDQVLDQWRIAETFTRHLTHATRYPKLKNLLYQMPERPESVGEAHRLADEHAARVAERYARAALEKDAQPGKLPAPADVDAGRITDDQQERDMNRRAENVRRYRGLREILEQSKAQPGERKGMA